MEGPQQFSGSHIESADVLGRRLAHHPAVTGAAGDAGHHHHVTHDDRPPGPAEPASQRTVPVQARPALVGEPESGNAASGGGVERVEILPAHQQQSPLVTAGPQGHPPGAGAGHLLQRSGEGRLTPHGLAGGGVERLDQPHGVRGVEHPVDQHRGRSEVGAHAEVREYLLELGVDTWTTPDHFEIGDRVAVDLVEWRVAGERLVTAKILPGGLDRLSAGERRDCAKQQHERSGHTHEDSSFVGLQGSDSATHSGA